jgi:anti-sigma regulatory factor (Ser/Thr protein kinase)
VTRPAPGAGLRATQRNEATLRLVLDNDLAAIESGRCEIRDWLGGGLSRRTTNRWEVVFEEVVSNIVRHGCAAGSHHTIVVDVVRAADGIEFAFEDDGRPFDPLAAPEPQALKSLETAPLGGLGVALVRRLSATMSYERNPKHASAGTVAVSGFTPRNRLRVSIATGE